MARASANRADATEAAVGILVDYGSPLARKVSGDVWSGLSRAALDSGYTRTTALWESLREERSARHIGESLIHIFVVGQDLPEAIEAVRPPGRGEGPRLYGVIVAVPDLPSPLAGSLLYQGVERLTGGGVRAGAVEPALLHARPRECEAYARRLLQRLAAMATS